MSWLDPGAAWWFALLPALLVLYLLRPRPRRLHVPSLRHWQAIPQQERTRAQIRRPPLSLLLLLQALLLAAGATALLQPARTAPAGHTLVILLDASGSMQARDGGTTRFAQALDAVRRLVAELSPDDRVTLLRVGAGVTTLCAACRGADLGAPLAAAQPGAARASWPAALGVAAGLAARQAAGQVETLVVSDGAFPPLPAGLEWPPLLHFVAVGAPVDNRAITALSARQPLDGTPGYEAYGRVANTGTADARLAVSAWADTVPLPTRTITLPAGGSADMIWQVPAGTARFTVRLPGGDALALDDEATLVLPDAAQTQVSVDAVEPAFYAHALAGIPGLVVTSTRDSRVGAADVTVIEGDLPAQLPAGPLLLVNPGGVLLPSEGTLTDERPLAGQATHPLLAGLDLGPLLVRRAQQLAPLPWLEPVLQAPDGPLLLAGQRDGRRIAVLAFDPRDSNLPSMAAFPLLMANLLAWLDPLGSAQSWHPAEPLPLAAGTAILAPDGARTVVGPSGSFAGTDTPGLYQARRFDGTVRTFAVDFGDAQESDLAPQAHPELELQGPAPADPRVTREAFWPVLAAAALVLLSAEWALFSWRRGRT